MSSKHALLRTPLAAVVTGFLCTSALVHADSGLVGGAYEESLDVNAYAGGGIITNFVKNLTITNLPDGFYVSGTIEFTTNSAGLAFYGLNWDYRRNLSHNTSNNWVNASAFRGTVDIPAGGAVGPFTEKTIHSGEFFPSLAYAIDPGPFHVGANQFEADKLSGVFEHTLGEDQYLGQLFSVGFRANGGARDWKFQFGGLDDPAGVISLTGHAVPSPGALSLLGLSGLVAVRRRRRR